MYRYLLLFKTQVIKCYIHVISHTYQFPFCLVTQSANLRSLTPVIMQVVNSFLTVLFWHWMKSLRLTGKGQGKDRQVIKKILWPPVIQVVDPRSFQNSWQCTEQYLSLDQKAIHWLLYFKVLLNTMFMVQCFARHSKIILYTVCNILLWESKTRGYERSWARA